MPVIPVEPETKPTEKKSILKTGNKFPIPVILLVLIILSLVLVSRLNSPKYIFKKEIDKAYKEIEEQLDEYDRLDKKFDFIHNNNRITADFDITSTEDEIDNLHALLELNYNLKDEFYNNNVKITYNDTNIDGKVYLQDKKIYIDSELLDKPLNITRVNSDMLMVYDYLQLDEIYDYLDKLDTDEIRYLLKFVKKEFYKTLDDKAFSKENVKKELNGKTVRLHKITYTIDEDNLRRTIESILKALRKDDKSLKIMAKYSMLDKSDIKEALDDALEEIDDIEIDEDIAISMYTQGTLNNAIGYTLEMDDKEYFSYINYKDYYEIKFDNNDKEYREKISIVGETEDGVTTYTIRRNKSKVGTVKVKELSDEKIDISFNFPDEDVKGSILITTKEYKDEISGEFDFNYEIDGEELKLKGTYKIETPSSLNEIDPKQAVDLDKDYNFKSLKEKINKLKDDDIREWLLDLVEEIEEKVLNLNSYGMIEKSYKEISSDLKNKQTFLLYVGNLPYRYDYNYKYYDDEEDVLIYEPTPEEEFLDTLIYYQDEYSFHTIYYENYSSYTKCGGSTYSTPKCIDVEQNYIEDLLLAEKDRCTTGYDCIYTKIDKTRRPVVYAIQEGKLVGILNTDSTEEDFEKVLEIFE